MYHPAGVYPAMPTPFRRNGDLDTGTLRDLITYFEGTGVNGLLVMGTAGEFAMMSEAERHTVIDVAMDAARGLEMIFNAGWASTRETIALTKYVKDAGASAVIAVEPYFYHPTGTGMGRHYLDIAAAADFPVIAYNIPAFAGNRLSPDILDDFARDSRVAGLKDSGGDAATLSDFIFRAPKDFAVLVGMDSLACAGLALGAKGMALGSAAIAPELCVRMYRAMKHGDHCRAFALQRSLDHAVRAMQVGTFPAAIKHAMARFGHPAGHVRAPLQDLDDAQRRAVEAHLENIRIAEEQWL